jgi:hypothetical protein
MRDWIWAAVLTAVLGCASAPPAPAGRWVLFDEAHHNVHTASGRYRPCVELVTAAGYQVTPNSSPFSAATLRGYDLVVIANARHAGPEAPLAERGRPAFTGAEADAVHDWSGPAAGSS